MLTVIPLLALSLPTPAQELLPTGRFRPEAPSHYRVTAVRGDHHAMLRDVEVRDAQGTLRRHTNLRGDGLLVTADGGLVLLDAGHSGSTAWTILGPEGDKRAAGRSTGMWGATLAADGSALVFADALGLHRVDMASLAQRSLGPVSAFAPGPQGRLAFVRLGENRIQLWRHGEQLASLSAPESLRKLAWNREGNEVFAMGAESFLAWTIGRDGARLQGRWSAPVGSQFADLRIGVEGPQLGARRQVGPNHMQGLALQPLSGGTWFSSSATATVQVSADNLDSVALGKLPWPLAPTAPYTVGNTYGEYQKYGGSPYMHPGVDIMGMDNEPVYAVEGGVVKAILTTSGQYHWRVAIASPGGGTSEGYLYAHLDLPTIPLQVGDVVTKGQFLGNLVPWPVASFTHIHFARIEDSGTQWFGDWLCTDNPHTDLAPHSDSTPPFFENAVGGDLFAFCNNQSSVYQDPDSLSGSVDIIVHVADQLGAGWDCTVQSLRYSIHPASDPTAPLVDNRLAFRADMALDTYQNGPVDPFLVSLLYKEDDTCNTDGSYNSREFFHVLTNSDGDEVYETSDALLAWDTTQLTDGDYVIVVRARDAAGNTSEASMTVTTNNGNP